MRGRNLGSAGRQLIGWLRGLAASRRFIQPGDKGIFDPYVPVGSLKQIANEYQADYGLTEQKEVFSDEEQSAPGYVVFKVAVFLIALVLGIRLIGLQITQGQENFSLAEGNRLEAVPTPAPRGLIFDRRGTALVRNVPNFSVLLHPADFPRKNQDQQAYLDRLSQALQANRQELEGRILPNLTKESVVLEEGVDRDRALSLEIKLQGLSGIELAKAPARFYSDLPSLGHLVGYIGKVTAEDQKQRPELLPTALTGKAGIEKMYDVELQGLPGAETLEVDSLGRTARSIGSTLPKPGRSLILGLDSEVQRTTADALRSAIEKNGATSGAAVAMDVRTGDIIAMVSYPTFDNNVFSSSIAPETRASILTDPAAPLINRAVAGQYPSGSTIKPVIAAAALEEKVIDPSTRLDTSEGKITVGQTTFSDWKTHGVTDVRQAIAESNNIFFFALGGGYKNISGLGINRLKGYLERFGFGDKTGIDLGEGAEASGLVPNPDWKKKVKKESWFIGDTYNTSIGQGNLLVTPLQLTRATAAIANGGDLMQPRLVKTILSPSGASPRELAVRTTRHQVVSPQTIAVVREGMRQTVLAGSARAFTNLSIETAAKTGTAQTSKSKDKTHSWFTAFAPYNNPEIAISVIVEGGGEGFAVAAPVARNMIERYFNLPLTPIPDALPPAPAE